MWYFHTPHWPSTCSVLLGYFQLYPITRRALEYILQMWSESFSPWLNQLTEILSLLVFCSINILLVLWSAGVLRSKSVDTPLHEMLQWKYLVQLMMAFFFCYFVWRLIVKCSSCDICRTLNDECCFSWSCRSMNRECCFWYYVLRVSMKCWVLLRIANIEHGSLLLILCIMSEHE